MDSWGATFLPLGLTPFSDFLPGPEPLVSAGAIRILNRFSNGPPFDGRCSSFTLTLTSTRSPTLASSGGRQRVENTPFQRAVYSQALSGASASTPGDSGRLK